MLTKQRSGSPFFSSKIPTINGIASPSSISTLIAEQERNQSGHLIRRAPPLNAQPHVIDGSACGTRLGPRGVEHGRFDLSSFDAYHDRQTLCLFKKNPRGPGQEEERNSRGDTIDPDIFRSDFSSCTACEADDRVLFLQRQRGGSPLRPEWSEEPLIMYLTGRVRSSSPIT